MASGNASPLFARIRAVYWIKGYSMPTRISLESSNLWIGRTRLVQTMETPLSGRRTSSASLPSTRFEDADKVKWPSPETSTRTLNHI